MRAKPLLLGHRGARLAAPENTCKAFDIALAHQCDGFEFDVRRTVDGRGLVCHDPKSQRLIVEQSRFEQFAAALSLEEVLQRYGTRAFLNIELKVAGLEERVVAALAAHPPQRGYLVSSFLPEVCQRLRTAKPGLRIGLICDSRRQLAHAAEVEISAVALHWKLANAKVIKEFQAKGLQVLIWTVNDVAKMLEFAELGVDAIISDNTRLLADTFHRWPQIAAGHSSR